jgi:phosphoribosylaminoimidazole-succinocarboxamide synthase
MSPAATASTVLDDLELPLPDRRVGKVRIGWSLPGDRRLFVTTDRLSVFDRVVALVPGKGRVLNELAWWWFGRVGDLVGTHALTMPDPNCMVVRAVKPLPVEVIVRGAITGVTSTSLWTRYEAGARVIDGHRLPDGLRKNELLAAPIITPTTKAAAGGHDEPLSEADVVARGLVGPALWEQTRSAALAVFARGQAVAGAAGLVLADTKYEFGVDADGRLLLIDEVHTPDSSRYWEAGSYEHRLSTGEEPESTDKEIVRRAFAELGYRGDGPVPALPPEVWERTAAAYERAFTGLTGAPPAPADPPTRARIISALTTAGVL